MKFSCAGFDIRVWPWNGPYSADGDEWGRHEVRFEALCSDLGLWLNEFQLLEIGADSLPAVIAAVRASSGCCLIAVEYPSAVLDLRDSGEARHRNTSLDLAEFEVLGYDICDVAALISVLHNPRLVARRGTCDLLPAGELMTALETVQLANFADPQHSPFAIARVSVLRVLM
jgi:hypothetical protein